MKTFKIGDFVLVTPKNGPMSGYEFQATIVDERNGNFIVEDQDSDFFEVEADEMELENSES